MINFGPVPIGAVLPVFFDSFAGATGASITISGLAVTDIEIYKGTSMTQRSSDAGYTLLDTDGIDIDTITGIHGFSVDTGDNTDAGFYASGSYYTVVVSAITVDGQTVNFVAATFRCVTAEGTAGQPVVSSVTGAVGSVTGAVGSVTGAVGSVTGAVGSVTGAVGSVTGLTASDVGAIKTKTDSLTFTVAGKVDANITHVIADPVKVNSTKTTDWGGT